MHPFSILAKGEGIFMDEKNELIEKLAFVQYRGNCRQGHETGENGTALNAPDCCSHPPVWHLSTLIALRRFCSVHLPANKNFQSMVQYYQHHWKQRLACVTGIKNN